MTLALIMLKYVNELFLIEVVQRSKKHIGAHCYYQKFLVNKLTITNCANAPIDQPKIFTIVVNFKKAEIFSKFSSDLDTSVRTNFGKFILHKHPFEIRFANRFARLRRCLTGCTNVLHFQYLDLNRNIK